MLTLFVKLSGSVMSFCSGLMIFSGFGMTGARQVISFLCFDRFGYYADNLDPDSPFGAGASAGGGGAGGFDFSGFDFSTGSTSGGGSSFRDIFSDLFGGGGASARPQPEPPRPMPKKGRDIEIPLAMSFEESFSGLTTNITVNRSEQCSRCMGAGDTGGPVVQCPTCKGSGQVMRAGGRLQFSQTCGDCEGTGRRRQPCSLCNGKGVTPKSEQVKIRIPAGVDTGSRVRIPKRAMAAVWEPNREIYTF